jgi:hypothetical protein
MVRRTVRFACPSCHASFQTAPASSAPVQVACAACGAAMQPEADVVDLHRIPTRRYDLQDLKARLALEREATEPRSEPAPEPGQVWFVGVAGRRVGPLTRAGLEGLKARGQLAGASLVWREGWPVWAAAEAVPELRPLLGLAPELVAPLPRELAAPPLPAQESLPFAALVEEVTDPGGLDRAAAAPSAPAAPVHESFTDAVEQATDPAAGRPAPLAEVTGSAAAPPQGSTGTGALPLPGAIAAGAPTPRRGRARRADAQFSAPSDSKSRPAARIGFAIALLALALLFTARACAAPPATPQASGGPP